MGTLRKTKQMDLFSVATRQEKRDLSSTFSNNMSLPIHRWFRYSAGFSATWVKELIEREKVDGRVRVLDPFAGSGTVLLETEAANISSIGVEAHPFVARIARAKLYWRENPQSYRSHALSVLNNAAEAHTNISDYPSLIRKCFPDEPLRRLDSLRRAYKASEDGSPYSELTWLTLVGILRACSPVGTAQWQYVLPNKRKLACLDPYEAFKARIQMIFEDMSERQKHTLGPRAVLQQDDARICSSVEDGWADLIITSPPYANNYDYADATRLEMSFFGEVSSWGDLQEAVRTRLIRSCTQHVSDKSYRLDEILKNQLLKPIQRELADTCNKLQIEREKHGGKKQYGLMIASYFSDMAHVWKSLRRVTGKGSLVCFVVGDSAPYGVYVPVDMWLGELALSSGFKCCSFEKTRDRNIKWMNRKHRVPLKEGRLWVRG